MNSKQLLLGTLAGTVSGLILGFLLYALAFSSYFAQNTRMKEEPDMILIVLGHVFMSFLLTYIFLQWAGIKTVSGGIRAAAIIGLLIALAYNIVMLGSSDFFSGGLIPALASTVVDTIIWVSTGAGVGWALGRGSSS